MALYGVSGRLNSGKDTVGSILQILLNSPQLSNEGVKDFLNKKINPKESGYYNNWLIRKFADKLKDIVCLLIGCTRSQLEDETFKNSVLGEEWWCYKIYLGNGKYELVDYLNNDKSEGWISIANPRYLVRMTPRLMLQLIGTEGGRQLIHPQIWVNSAFSDYKLEGVQYKLLNPSDKECSPEIPIEGSGKFPNWIFTDMRFPNEAQAIKDRAGVLIRIERPWFYELMEDGRHMFSNKEDRSGHVYFMAAKYTKEEAEVLYQDDYASKVHESETALDNYQDWSYIITNDGTLDDLIDKVRIILEKEGLLTKTE